MTSAVWARHRSFVLNDVLREALANVAKHARTPEATIRVVVDDDRVAVRVESAARAGSAALPGAGIGLPGRSAAGDDARSSALTDRELDVLRLMARGATNPEIADRLLLAESTVTTHVGALFTKLGTRDRAAAIVYAYDAGIVRPRTPD